MRRSTARNGGDEALKFESLGTITINKEIWEYGWGDAGKTKGIPDDGSCSYKKKRIVISPSHTRSILEIIPHEVAHAFFPDAKEKTILALGACVEELFKAYTNAPR
jgi:hypothetical protein